MKLVISPDQVLVLTWKRGGQPKIKTTPVDVKSFDGRQARQEFVHKMITEVS